MVGAGERGRVRKRGPHGDVTIAYGFQSRHHHRLCDEGIVVGVVEGIVVIRFSRAVYPTAHRVLLCLPKGSSARHKKRRRWPPPRPRRIHPCQRIEVMVLPE